MKPINPPDYDDFAEAIRRVMLAYDALDREVALASLIQHDHVMQSRREARVAGGFKRDTIAPIAPEMLDIIGESRRIYRRLRILSGRSLHPRHKTRKHVRVDLSLPERNTQCTTAKTTRTRTVSKARRK